MRVVDAAGPGAPGWATGWSQWISTALWRTCCEDVDALAASRPGLKWPKAAAKITDDLDVLLAFSDYPAEHWVHLRTTNPIESTFATVRLRQ